MNSLTEDGWNDVKLFVEFPDGSVASDAPDAINNPIEREVCLDSSTSGVFYITAAVEDPAVKPRNPWGVFWTVTICQGNTTQVFTGGYNTTFILSFDSNLREWALIYEENIKPNERVCSACESNECDADNNDNDPNKPNPKPRLRRRRRDDDDKKRRRKGNDDRKNRKPSGGKKSNDDDHNNNNSTRRQLDHHSNTSVISAPTVSYEPYVDAKVSMFDEEGDGWWFNDYLGISWYLADSTRTTLFYTGTLCNGTSGFCNICLADGDYTFRVSGIKSSFVSWNFCGVRGSYGEELIFEVQDNECFPIALLDLSNPSPQTITYVFESKLEVCLKEEYLNLTDPRAIATITNTLNEVLGVNSSSVIIEAKSDDDNNNGPNKPSLPSSRRDGKKKRHSKNDNNNDNNNNSTDVDEPEPEIIYTHTIKFTITIKVESDELHIDELLETYENLLAQKILNGTFVSTLISNSLVYGYLPFNWTSCAVSSEFNYVEAHFDSSLPFISSSILASDTHNQEVISSYDYSAITLFFGSVLIGIIAFVGIISKGLKTYDTLSNTSEHDFELSSTHSTSSHGLLPFSQIDMDQSVSNPLGRNAAAEVQMGQVRDSL